MTVRRKWGNVLAPAEPQSIAVVTPRAMFMASGSSP